MNRMVENVRVLMLVVVGALIVCSMANAETRGEAPISKRVHQELERFLRARASEAVNQVEIPQLGAFDEIGVAPEDVEIELRTRNSGLLSGRVPVTVVLSDGVAERKRAVVTASLRAVAPVYVASRSLRRGEVVTREDVRRERRDVSVLRGPVISRESALVGMRVRRSINVGRVWQPRHLESVPTVKRGELVRLRVQSGGLRIDGSGKASEDGRAGEWIRVLNTVSKRYVTGQVDAEGTVYVRF